MGSIFTAIDGTNGRELWVTRGGAAATLLVKDIRPGLGSSNPEILGNLLVAGTIDPGHVLFLADDGTSGAELWITDGSLAGTVQFKDIDAGAPGSFASAWTAVGTKAVFAATTAAAGRELWVSDGTAGGTALLLDANAGVADANPAALGALLVNGTIDAARTLFVLDDGSHGREIWSTNGTAAGTVLLKDINVGAGSANVTPWTAVNGHAVFTANDGTHGNELWVSDGTAASTVLLVDAALETASSDPELLGRLLVAGVANAGTLLFALDDLTHGNELWVTDGTAAGTVLFKDINPGVGSAAPSTWAAVNGRAVFTADDGTNGRELWVSDGTAGGTTLLKNARTGAGLGSDPELLGPLLVGGVASTTKLLFALDDGVNGRELWTTDGTAAGTVLFKNINPGAGSAQPTTWTSVNGRAVFIADDGTHGSELWVSDGTAAGTTLLLDANPGANGSTPTLLGNAATGIGTATDPNKLLFLLDDGVHGQEIWVTDGTAAGTTLLKDVNTGVAGSFATSGTPVNEPPTLSIAVLSASKVEGSGGGATAFTFRVTRSGNLAVASGVSWAATGSGANPANAVDFAAGVLPSGTLAFAASEATKDITVNVQADSSIETDEGFTVTLSSPTGATLVTSAASGKILNDDTLPPPTLSVAATSASKPEGSGGGTTAYTFTVTRSGDLSVTSGVAWAVTGSGASPASLTDFAAGLLPSGTLAFATSEASKTITVNVQADGSVEPDEGFTVTLSAPTGATLTTSTATGTIQNDDTPPPPTLSIAVLSASKAEGSGGGATAFTFRVTRIGDLSVASDVSWAATGSGASPANLVDFAGGVLPSGTLAFAASEATKDITVNVLADNGIEPNEGFTVTLSSPTGATLGTSTAAGTIQNDDTTPPVLETFTISAAEFSARLAELDAKAEAGLVAAINLTDDGVPVIALTADQLASGKEALRFITREFVVDAQSSGMRGHYAAIAAANLGGTSGISGAAFVDGRLVFNNTDRAAQVVRLYQAALDRVPDQGGLNTWIDFIEQGVPLTNLADAFIGSAEFQGRFGANLSDDAFIVQLYANVLHRAPDAGGLANWVTLLGQGLSRAQALVGFSESDENKTNTSGLVGAGIWDLDNNAPRIARLYDTVFGRIPDVGGLHAWDGALDSGALSLLDVATGFVGSDEFRSVYGGLSTADFVVALYNNTLHRGPDQGGLDNWVALLDSGATTRASVVLGFAESVEHQNNMMEATMSENPARYGVVLG